MRLGTKIPWPYNCNLCGRGYGDESKIISMAINIPMGKSEGINTDDKEVSICNDCTSLPIFKLVLYLTGRNYDRTQQ